MKLRLEKTLSGSHSPPHTHRRRSRLSAWPPRFRTYTAAEQDVFLFKDDCCSLPQYSPTLVSIFEHAIRRCPSISMDAKIMEGQPCISGTRIPVRSVLRALEQYGSIDGAVECYPHLNVQLVKDALYFSQIVLEPPNGIHKTEVAD